MVLFSNFFSESLWSSSRTITPVSTFLNVLFNYVKVISNSFIVAAEYHIPWEVLKNLGPVIDDGSYSPQQYLEFKWTPKQAHVLTFKDEVIPIRELDVS